MLFFPSPLNPDKGDLNNPNKEGRRLSTQSPKPDILESKIFNNSFHSPQTHQSPTPTEYSTYKIAPFPLSSLTAFSSSTESSPWLSYLPQCCQFLTHLSSQAMSSFLHTSGKSPCSSDGLPWIFPSGPHQRVYSFTTPVSKLRSPFNHGDLATESWIPPQIPNRACLTRHAFVHPYPLVLKYLPWLLPPQGFFSFCQNLPRNHVFCEVFSSPIFRQI